MKAETERRGSDWVEDRVYLEAYRAWIDGADCTLVPFGDLAVTAQSRWYAAIDAAIDQHIADCVEAAKAERPTGDGSIDWLAPVLYDAWTRCPTVVGPKWAKLVDAERQNWNALARVARRQLASVEADRDPPAGLMTQNEIRAQAGAAFEEIYGVGVVPPKSPKSGELIGEAAYNAYSREVGGKAINGDALPVWADLPAKIQIAWTVAGVAAAGAGKPGDLVTGTPAERADAPDFKFGLLDRVETEEGFALGVVVGQLNDLSGRFYCVRLGPQCALDSDEPEFYSERYLKRPE